MSLAWVSLDSPVLLWYLPHEGDVDTEITMNRRAVEANVDSIGCTSPSRVLCATVEAYLEEAEREQEAG